VKEHAAIVLEPSKAYLVETRLAPLALREGIESIEVLVERLRNTHFGPLHAKVVDAVTTSETSFFRDFHPFEARRKILGRIRQALQPDGYLFLGATETTLHADDAFERVAVERSWAYRLRRS